jgi:hypothetical protein
MVPFNDVNGKAPTIAVFRVPVSLEAARSRMFKLLTTPIRARAIVPEVIDDPAIFVIEEPSMVPNCAVLIVPEVRIEAGNEGIRATANDPVVIADEGNDPTTAVLKVPALTCEPFKTPTCAALMVPDTCVNGKVPRRAESIVPEVIDDPAMFVIEEPSIAPN